MKKIFNRAVEAGRELREMLESSNNRKALLAGGIAVMFTGLVTATGSGVILDLYHSTSLKIGAIAAGIPVAITVHMSRGYWGPDAKRRHKSADVEMARCLIVGGIGTFLLMGIGSFAPKNMPKETARQFIERTYLKITPPKNTQSLTY